MPRTALRRYFRHGLFPQLMVFEAVARLKSATRAAEELHLAQPTVSTQIRKLSETLGIALLQHRGRGLEPTAAGVELRAACEELIALFERTEARLAALRVPKADVLRVGAAPDARRVAARLVAAFCVSHPSTRVDLHVAELGEALARLISGKDDLCVIPACEHPSVATSPIVALDAQGFPLLHDWRIGRRKDAPLSPTAELFLREAIEAPHRGTSASWPRTLTTSA